MLASYELAKRYKSSEQSRLDQNKLCWFNIGRGQPVGRTNVTLILVTFVVSGTSTGGVGTTTAFLDFPSEAKYRAAADVLAGARQ